MTSILWWIAIGVTIGTFQTFGLWRSVQRRSASVLAGAWRVPLVAGVLVLAALSGGLLPAAGGWACGFAAAGAVAAMRGVR